MRCPVKTVPSDIMFAVKCIWESIKIRMIGHSLMECSIEYCNLGNIGIFFQGNFYDHEVFRIMERGKRNSASDGFYPSRVNQRRLLKSFSAMDNTMPDTENPSLIIHAAGFRC